MNKTTLVFLIGICFTSSAIFGQSKSVADRYYNEYSYIKSAEVYESLVKRGDSSQVTLQRLADSYYNNVNIEEAKTWYAVLFNKHKANLSKEYYYKYAQTLKSLGDTATAKKIFNEYTTLAKDDVRAKNILEGLILQEDKEVAYKNIKNLDINTSYSDFNGFVNNGELTVFSTKPTTNHSSKIYKWNKQPFLNAFQGAIDDSKEITNLKIVAGDVNTKYHEATLVITKDGKTMYFTRDNYTTKRLIKSSDKTTNLKLYKAELKDGAWVNVTELPFNSDEYSVGQPTLSNDESTLFFVSDMPGGIGGTDIYKVAINEGNFETPVNLGSNINTEGMEMFPFVAENNNLYFSSNGRFGYGLLDVYKVNLNNINTNTVYNLGTPINSNRDDFAFTLINEKNGYFSSNREGGKGDDDIYSFSTEEVKCLESIAGVIYDNRTKEPISEATVQLIDEAGKVIETVTTNTQGAYTFTEQDCNQNFTVRSDKKDYKNAKNEVRLLSENGAVRTLDLYLDPIIATILNVRQIVVNPIYFDLDKYNIRPDAALELETVVTVLNDNPNMVIKIEAHTDSRGSDAYNMKLSDRRAKSTRDYILSKGISSNRIESAKGFGESKLINKCANGVQCTEAQHQNNRRSLFIILKEE